MNHLKEKEQKLDIIVSTLNDIKKLLEKLVPPPITINSPISVKSEEGKNVDINKHLYELAEKISRRHPPQTMSDKEFKGKLTKVLVDSEKTVDKNKEGISKEEFVKRADEIDWTKILESKIRLLDEKGKDIGVRCNINKDDGSVVCEPFKGKEETTVGWSLKKDDIKVYNLPKSVTVEEFTKMLVKPTSLHFTRVGTDLRKLVGRNSQGNTVITGYWQDDGTVIITSYCSKHFSD